MLVFAVVVILVFVITLLYACVRISDRSDKQMTCFHEKTGDRHKINIQKEKFSDYQREK